jgi:phosphate transport system permease protein
LLTLAYAPGVPTVCSRDNFFTTDMRQPIATLTVQVFTYAISPYDDWHRQAWAGALVLVTIVRVC